MKRSDEPGSGGLPTTLGGDRRAFELAWRVAEGSAIDWDGEEAAAADEEQRAIVRELRAVAALVVRDRKLHPARELPARIGPYRILQFVSEGGMGLVYEAEQEHPVRRRVALKVLKPGMDTRQVVARFESERQALALMTHPFIARVFEAGETQEGRPYVAMEYVPGPPITEFCQRQKLSIEARLALFADVCDAVQHAHQKAVIHRDLKPSNVLVMLDGDRAVPKVIDFGIAKALAQPLTEKTLVTELGRFMGTPAYMSPEQAELTKLDIDTRADVYSLGVLLFELLTGSLPFGASRGTPLEEVRRQILYDDPPLPSTRVPLPVAQRLRGDLDWIVLRALEKDRTRRYASASELAADVRRHLADEPVLAAAPGRSYRLRKFLRRHRAGAAATAFVALAFAISAAGTVVGLVRATAAEHGALEEALTAQQTADFLAQLFEVADTGQANTVTAREILAAGAARIERELTDRPLVQARLMGTVAEAYLELDMPAEARPLAARSLEIRRRVLGDRDPETGRTRRLLADVVRRLERADEAVAVRSEVSRASR